jgi:hypothetical protein
MPPLSSRIFLVTLRLSLIASANSAGPRAVDSSPDPASFASRSGARAIVHDYRAAEGLAELVRHGARQRIGTAARGEGRDELDRLRRVGLLRLRT